MSLIKADPKRVSNEAEKMSQDMNDQQPNDACNFCRADAPKLTAEQIRQELSVVPDWRAIDVDGITRIERNFTFPDFAQALAFTNLVGEFAESIGHHPEILTRWGAVSVTWYTHKIEGVQQGDFLCAIETELRYAKMNTNE